MKTHKKLIAGIWAVSLLGLQIKNDCIYANSYNLSSVFPVKQLAEVQDLNEKTPTIKVQGASGKAGETVEVRVDLLNNPGIMALKFDVSYDTEKLKLIEATDCKNLEGLDSTFGKDVNVMPYKCAWDSTDANVKTNGTAAIFKFEILEGIEEGETEVSVELDKSSTFNVDMEEVEFECVAGTINITDGETVTTSDSKTTDTGLVSTIATSVTKESVTTTEYHTDLPTIKVQGASGKAGETVEVRVDLLNNPGIMALKFDVSYDTEKLKLIEATDCKNLEGLDSTFGKDVNVMPYKCAWDSTDANVKTNGTAAIFKFEILEGIEEGETEVSVELDKSSTFNVDMEEVEFECVAGIINITDDETVTTSDSKTTDTGLVSTIATSITKESVTTTEYHTDLPTIKVQGASGKAGETVEVRVDLLNNPGIMALKFDVSYDTEKLKLIEATDCKNLEGLDSTFGKDVNVMPYKCAWDSTDANVKTNGTAAIFKFEILEGIEEGETEVSVELDKSSTFNVDMEEVEFECVAGIINITDDETVTTNMTTTITSTTTKPATTTTKPVTTTPEPTTTTKPATTTPEPTTTTKPATTTPKPTTTTKPVTTTPKPTTTTKPVTTTSEPTTTTKPVTTTPKPTTTTKPVTTTSETTTTTKPVTMTSETTITTVPITTTTITEFTTTAPVTETTTTQTSLIKETIEKDGLKYEIDDKSNTAKLVDFDEIKDDIIIPDEVSGKKVTDVSDDIIEKIKEKDIYIRSENLKDFLDSNNIEYELIKDIEIILGDVDNNGEITSYDALLILQNVVGLEEFSEIEKIKADVDMDSEITSHDALIILQYVVGTINDFQGMSTIKVTVTESGKILTDDTNDETETTATTASTSITDISDSSETVLPVTSVSESFETTTSVTTVPTESEVSETQATDDTTQDYKNGSVLFSVDRKHIIIDEENKEAEADIALQAKKDFNNTGLNFICDSNLKLRGIGDDNDWKRLNQLLNLIMESDITEKFTINARIEAGDNINCTFSVDNPKISGKYKVSYGEDKKISIEDDENNSIKLNPIFESIVQKYNSNDIVFSVDKNFITIDETNQKINFNVSVHNEKNTQDKEFQFTFNSSLILNGIDKESCQKILNKIYDKLNNCDITENIKIDAQIISNGNIREIILSVDNPKIGGQYKFICTDYSEITFEYDIDDNAKNYILGFMSDLNL